MNNTELFAEFCLSADSLRVYHSNRLVFSSTEKMLLPLLKYLDEYLNAYPQSIIMDKIAGNAAALLMVICRCAEVYSPLGSRHAVNTFRKNNIKYHITEVVPFINRPGTDIMCPMEELSLGKMPDQFYTELK